MVCGGGKGGASCVGGGGGEAVAVDEGRFGCGGLDLMAWMWGDSVVAGGVMARALPVFAWRAIFSGDLKGLLRALSSRRRFAGCSLGDMLD